MANTFDEIAWLYGNIIDEAKQRLHAIKRAATHEVESRIGPAAVSDLCALQFRKVFEGIAVGCVLVHGDLPGAKKLKDDFYRADKLLNVLEKLHPDFYPKPCTVTKLPGTFRMNCQTDHVEGLTKADLLKLYFEFDHHMHVGTLSRRSLDAANLPAEKVFATHRKADILIRSHVIKIAGEGNGRLICIARGLDEAPLVISAAAE